MKAQRWPDFIVIGAGKSGTTALNEYLNQHPEIFMALEKEPNFFGLENVDINSYDIPESRDYHLASIYKKEDYLELYHGAKAEQKTGEISNLYLYSDQAHLAIKNYAPDAKLIALLRQPADRLFSRYLHMVREENVPEQGLPYLFDRNSIWWKRPDLVNEGFYFRHLEKYFKLFPKENIRVYLYDDFRKDPGLVLSDIFEFIGVNRDFIVDTDIVVNKSGLRKKNLFNVMLGQNGYLIGLSKSLFPQLHQTLKYNKDVVKYLNKARNKHIISKKISAELRERITQEIYRDDIIQLSKLLERDLSAWLNHPRIKSSNAS